MRRVVDRPPTSNACTSSLVGSGETACNFWASEVPTDLTNFDPRRMRTSPVIDATRLPTTERTRATRRAQPARVAREAKRGAHSHHNPDRLTTSGRVARARTISKVAMRFWYRSPRMRLRVAHRPRGY